MTDTHTTPTEQAFPEKKPGEHFTETKELRIKEEVETRAERIKKLTEYVERYFPGDELAELRQHICRSFEVPQRGEYHNEGMLMDRHLELAIKVIDDLKNGITHPRVPEHIAALMQDVLQAHEEDIFRYVFLHDIAKADTLFIRYEDKTKDTNISWEEWQSMAPEEIRKNPQLLEEFCQKNGIKSFGYYIDQQETHGNLGAQKLQEYTSLEIPDMVYLTIRHHEAAHHFNKIKGTTYKKFFEKFSSEEESWVILASYVDTMASLKEDGEPNLSSFLNMVDSIKNYRVSEVAEKILSPDTDIKKRPLQKTLSKLRNTDQPTTGDPVDIIDHIRQTCVEPTYNKTTLHTHLQALTLSEELGINTETINQIIEAVHEETGVVDNKILGNIVKTLHKNAQHLVKNAFQDSKNKVLQKDRRHHTTLTSKELFDTKARNTFIEVESFEQTLETADLTPEKKAQLFMRAFVGNGTVEKIKLLDQAGIIEELLPEFGRNRNLTQDPRHHGTETIGEQAFRASAHMEAKLATSPVFADARFASLLRIAAFTHDIGKNEDDNKSPEQYGREGVGYRVVTQKKGEGFQRVRFVGHEKQGGKILKDTLHRLSKTLPASEQLRNTDMQLISLWVQHHMRAISITRDLTQHTVDELVDQIVRDIYPAEFLNARIPLADVVRASMMLQETELELTYDSDDKDTWLASWDNLKSEVEDRLPTLESQNKEKLMIPLVRGQDLTELNIPTQYRTAFIAELTQRQAIGEIIDRKNALITLASLAQESGIAIDKTTIERLAGHGAFRSVTARMENFRLVDEEVRDGYVVKKFDVTPLEQFTKDTPIEEIERILYSGNFPNLVEHMKKNNVSTRDLTQLMFERGFANLLQLEFFVKQYCHEGEHIINVAQTRSPLMRSMEISRALPDGSDTTIVVNNGYQGAKDHTGAGIIHIGEQRQEALNLFYRREGESVDDMTKRFFEEAVIHVAGSAQLIIPSDYDTDRFAIMLAPIQNSKNQKFSGVIVDTSGKKCFLLTCVFYLRFM